MRTAFLAALTILALASSAAAQDKTKPNTLTPREIADGWVMLFDGETTFGWRTETSKAEVKPNLVAQDGALAIVGSDWRGPECQVYSV